MGCHSGNEYTRGTRSFIENPRIDAKVLAGTFRRMNMKQQFQKLAAMTCLVIGIVNRKVTHAKWSRILLCYTIVKITVNIDLWSTIDPISHFSRCSPFSLCLESFQLLQPAQRHLPFRPFETALCRPFNLRWNLRSQRWNLSWGSLTQSYLGLASSPHIPHHPTLPQVGLRGTSLLSQWVPSGMCIASFRNLSSCPESRLLCALAARRPPHFPEARQNTVL